MDLRVVIFSSPHFWNTQPLDLCPSHLKCHILRETVSDHPIYSSTQLFPVILPNHLSYLQSLSLFEIILFIHFVNDLLIIYKPFTDYLHLSLLPPLTFQKVHSMQLETLLSYSLLFHHPVKPRHIVSGQYVISRMNE